MLCVCVCVSRLRQCGRKVFVATNSGYQYTKVQRHLLSLARFCQSLYLFCFISQELLTFLLEDYSAEVNEWSA